MNKKIRIFSIIILAAMVMAMAACTTGPYQTREEDVSGFSPVSYTHLTLPTIYSV
mgnify:CR=1 FL=1